MPFSIPKHIHLDLPTHLSYLAPFHHYTQEMLHSKLSSSLISSHIQQHSFGLTRESFIGQQCTLHTTISLTSLVEPVSRLPVSTSSSPTTSEALKPCFLPQIHLSAEWVDLNMIFMILKIHAVPLSCSLHKSLMMLSANRARKTKRWI